MPVLPKLLSLECAPVHLLSLSSFLGEANAINSVSLFKFLTPRFQTSTTVKFLYATSPQ